MRNATTFYFILIVVVYMPPIISLGRRRTARGIQPTHILHDPSSSTPLGFSGGGGGGGMGIINDIQNRFSYFSFFFLPFSKVFSSFFLSFIFSIRVRILSKYPYIQFYSEFHIRQSEN
jgi:hypothetical protein